MNLFKTIVICSFLISFTAITFEANGQEKSTFKSSVYMEIIPWAQMTSGGNGIAINYNIGRAQGIRHSLSLSILYNSFDTGFELRSYTLNGQPIRDFGTEVDINTDRPYPWGAVNSLDFENLDVLGVKHLTPKMGYRLNRSVSYGLSYPLRIKKLSIWAGAGITAGITDREDTHVGFTANIDPDIIGDENPMWVNINIRARYLYLGAFGHVSAEYKIRENLIIGLKAGAKYIFDRNFQEDVKIPFTAVTIGVDISK